MFTLFLFPFRFSAPFFAFYDSFAELCVKKRCFCGYPLSRDEIDRCMSSFAFRGREDFALCGRSKCHLHREKGEEEVLRSELVVEVSPTGTFRCVFPQDLPEAHLRLYQRRFSLVISLIWKQHFVSVYELYMFILASLQISPCSKCLHYFRKNKTNICIIWHFNAFH